MNGSRHVMPYRMALEARHLIVTASGYGGGGQAVIGSHEARIHGPTATVTQTTIRVLTHSVPSRRLLIHIRQSAKTTIMWSNLTAGDNQRGYYKD